MKTLQKIIAGAVLTGASMLAYNANAQQSLAPTKVATETSIASNDDITGVCLHRTELGNGNWKIKYDINSKMLNTVKPNDVAMLYVDKLFDVNNTKVGADYIYYGNYDRDGESFVDLYLTRKFKDITATLDLEKSFRNYGPSREYAAIRAQHPNAIAYFGAWDQMPFAKGFDMIYFGHASYFTEHGYASLGNKFEQGYAAIGVKGLKDFGEFTYGVFNRDAGTIWIKSQTAFGNANAKIFNTDIFEMASDYFTGPAFFPIHLGPVCSKGDIDLKLEYKNNSKTNVTETELMLGTDKTPVQVGLGVNTCYKDGKSVSDVAVELYKNIKFGKFNGSIEYRFNNRTKESTGYVKMAYMF